MEQKPYEELKNMVKYGGRKHQMEALTYGYQDIISDLSQSNDREVSQFAEHLDNHPEFQVERQRAIYEKGQKDAKSHKTMGWLFLGGAIAMYIATIVLFFLPYLLHANHGIYYFIGAFVALLIGGALIGCYFMITKPKLRYALSKSKEYYQNLDYAKRFQAKMYTWIKEGRYD